MRDDAAGLDGMTAAAMHAQRLFNHVIRFGERLVDVAGRLFHEAGDVVRLAVMHHRRASI